MAVLDSADMEGPQFSTTHGHTSVLPHYLAEGQFSAYGTTHPIDVALGKLRRLHGFKAAAHGGAESATHVMHLARAISQPVGE